MLSRHKIPILLGCLLLVSCSPRDFLTRRLAADLIAGSTIFRTPQAFQLRTGVMSNKDYLAPDYLTLQHHGWVSATSARCPPDISPPPCSDVALTPAGVETFQSLIAPGDTGKQFFSIPILHRDLISISGIARQGDSANVGFTWRWVPMNEVGAAFHSGSNDFRYSATAIFRRYDDGWRVIESNSSSGAPLDQALQNAEPAQ